MRVPTASRIRLVANTSSAGPGLARLESPHHRGCLRPSIGLLLNCAERSRVRWEMMIGSIILLVMIISSTPMQAVTPSS
ncbi:hypothetical protein D3C81_1682900 [compost metagenome]